MPARNPNTIPTRTVISTHRPRAPTNPPPNAKRNDKPISATSTTSTKPPDTPTENPSPISTLDQFPALLAEADRLTRQDLHTAALALYNRALVHKPESTTALTSRATCHLATGHPDLALADAEDALTHDPNNSKAIAIKADALFAGGDFEGALVWYHRGMRIRPDMEVWEKGVVRATRAIRDAVSGIDVRVLRERMVIAKAEAAKREAKPGKKGLGASSISANGPGMLSYHPGAIGRTFSNQALRKSNTNLSPSQESKPIASRPSSSQRPRSAGTITANLLEDLYADHLFLQSLASDKSFMAAAGGEIAGLVNEGCRFMESRIEFWRITNPTGRPRSGMPKRKLKKTKGQSNGESRVGPGAASPLRRPRNLEEELL